MKRVARLAVAGSSLWSDLLLESKVPADALDSFEAWFGVTKSEIKKVLSIAKSRGGEFSELYFQYKISNSINMEEGIIKETAETISLGVGIRVLAGEKTGYGYTNDLSFEAMKNAALTAAAIANEPGNNYIANLFVSKPNRQVADLNKSMAEIHFPDKLSLVEEANNGANKYDNRINKVRIMLGDSLEYVTIINSDGLFISDVRPQTRMIVISLAEKNGIRNSGLNSGGGRVGLDYFKKMCTPKEIGEKASEEAIILLDAKDAVAGEQPVVLGVGQSGVMIHEAVGHPLEADGNRKGTSIMSDKFGKKVAHDIVTIYEDPTIPNFRGSLNIDDEGMESKKTVLVENGKLVGYIQDKLSAKIMKMEATGNGRRQSYQFNPIPRMTNTVLAEGNSDPEEIIKSVKKGFYAKSYQGGQVEESGKFVFSVNLGYQIENGKLTYPLKNATLIGTNVQILNKVSMIGNDMGYFLGSCGKEGQSVPVTAGTPTLKIDRMTVGGRQ
ncbi:TldD/PmbA family protein [candidate division KSB1 bacterium]|nr:TldD/PmbA family protein [candidate division KSB1 bacterium]MBL7092617.1 TldD/PmbA family protein [candidate division KSB1 bacterium]